MFSTLFSQLLFCFVFGFEIDGQQQTKRSMQECCNYMIISLILLYWYSKSVNYSLPSKGIDRAIVLICKTFVCSHT